MRRYRDIGYDSSRWDGFAFREGDIVISAPAKSGTTWLQTLIAMLVFDSADVPGSLSRLSPWLDMQTRSLRDVVGDLEAQTHRRVIKTHTPLDGVPIDGRVVYVTIGRDPRDIAISFMSQTMNVNRTAFMAEREAAVGLDDLPELTRPTPPPVTSFQEVFHRWFDFDDDGTTFGLQGVVHHMATFWERRHASNIVLTHYADLSSDLTTGLRHLAERLELTPTDTTLEEIAAAGSFDAMKANADRLAPNADQGIWNSNADFFRRGGQGEWREVWDEETVRRYNERVTSLAEPELVAWMQEGGVVSS